MKKSLLASLPLAISLVVLGCDKGGGGGASGVTGTWHLDLSALVAAQKAQMMPAIRQQMQMVKEQMKQFEALPADQRAEAEKAVMDQVPPEQRDIAKAMMQGDQAGEAAIERMVDAQMGKISGTLEVNSDKSFTTDFHMGAEKTEKRVGTWSQDGANYTFVTKTKDGQPVDAEEAKPLVLTLKDGRLTGMKEGQEIVFKR
jgi:hypothetical protein